MRRPSQQSLLSAEVLLPLVGAWLVYAVAFGLAVAAEARTAELAWSRWLAHVGTGIVAGLLMAWVATRFGGRRVLRQLCAAALLSVVWAVMAASVLDVLTGETQWMLSYRAHPGRARWQLLVGVFMYGVTTLAVTVTATRQQLRSTRLRLEREARLRAEAQLAAVRARVDPHFLFNTLHSMVAIARDQPREVVSALERFAALLRYALRASGPTGECVTWASEWRAIHDYLALERIRLGSRLVLRESIDDDSLACSLPALIVQPLIENAINHAVAVQSTPTTVQISSRIEDDNLVIEVADDGPGFVEDSANDDGGHGFALESIRQRLRLRYGDAQSVSVESGPGAGFTVELRIPCEEGGA